MRGLLNANPVFWPSCRHAMRNAMVLFAITTLSSAPALAQYAEEWHEWHGQQGPDWLPPPAVPSLGLQYGAGYPAPGYYYPDHSYGYDTYPAQRYSYGYSAGFSDGFAAGYDHGFTGGLNNAFADTYDGGYADPHGYSGYYGYANPYQGY